MTDVTLADISLALHQVLDHKQCRPAQEASQDIDLDDIARPNAFAKRYPDAIGSLSRLRYLLRNRHNNGLISSGAVVERGRAIFIVKPKFLNWLVGGSA